MLTFAYRADPARAQAVAMLNRFLHAVHLIEPLSSRIGLPLSKEALQKGLFVLP